MKDEKFKDRELLIEQPEWIKGRTWIFVVGYTGGMNAGLACNHISRIEVERRCSSKAGAGALVKKRGKWYWRIHSEKTKN